MNFDEILQLIAAAKGQPDQLALATVEIVLAGQPEADREPLRAALDAAAIPHWFDAALLAQLIDPLLVPRAKELFERLRSLPFVEAFPLRGETAQNVHEATRLPWRARLYRDNPARFLELTQRAVASLPPPGESTAPTPHRIEALYHRLVVLPAELAASQNEALAKEWECAGRLDARQALAFALAELESAGFLSGIVRASALMEMAEARWHHQTLDLTAGMVQTAQALCLAAADQRRLARTLLLLGRVEMGRGNLPAALLAFEKCEVLRRVCASESPADPELESELGDVYCYIGHVRKYQSDLPGALAAFQVYNATFDKLTIQDPANTVWQRELAVSHSRVGDVRLAQGDLPGARTAFEADLTISQKLAALDPANAAWQRDLADSHSKVGDVRLAQGDLAGARAAFEADQTISQKLAALDPANAAWQRDLAVSHNRVGDVCQAQGDLAGARAAFEADLTISQKLAALDPANAAWQRDLAVSHNKLGTVCWRQKDYKGSLAAFEEHLNISQKLVALDPTNAVWREALTVSHECMASVLQALGDSAKASEHENAATAIRASLNPKSTAEK